MAKKKSTKKKAKSLTLILQADYRHHIEVNYTTTRASHCECRMGCKHCVKLSDIDIKGPYDDICVTLTNYICKNIPCSNIQIYCINRLLRCAKIYEPDAWTVSPQNGYYGEELGSVSLDFSVVHELEKSITELLSFKDPQKEVEYILIKEYGVLLDRVKQLYWNDDWIKPKDLVIGQQDHYRHVDQQVVNMYQTFPWAKGIVVKQDDKYHLIDGYHRMAAELSQSNKEINVIVGEVWA